MKKLQPEFAGFRYLRKGSYSAGGVSNTVHEYMHDATGMEFILIPAGSFEMGDNEWNWAKLVHTVNVKSFLLAKIEVTQGMYEKIMGNNC